MQDLKVTLVQVNQVWENKEANFSLFESFFQRMEKSDLVVLPEMFHTGFSMSVERHSEDWGNSEGLDFLKKWSAKLDAAIYTSLIIRDDGKYYNRGVFVYPDGNINYYDKRKSFGLGGEDKFYTAGSKEVIVEWRGWKINLQICYDLRFPELIRNRIVRGIAAYDMILYVANWPEKRIAHWDTLLQARAIENQCYAIGVNRVGIDGNGLIYNGGSLSITPMGEKLLTFTNNQEASKTAALSKAKLEEIRAQLPFLKDS